MEVGEFIEDVVREARRQRVTEHPEAVLRIAFRRLARMNPSEACALVAGAMQEQKEQPASPDSRKAG